MSDTFLKADEIRTLTGRAHIALQIKALAKMGIPYFVNGIGRPVVARSAIEGRAVAAAAQPKKAWVPQVLKAG